MWRIIFAYTRVKCFIVLIADYQMVSKKYKHMIVTPQIQDKSVPYFGKTEQVSFSFFSYHLPISIFGLVDVTRNKKYVYLTDKYQAGSKSGNHTSNFILQYVQFNSAKLCIQLYSFMDNFLPWYIQSFELVMDNAGNVI